MKTNSLPLVAFLAALASGALLPISPSAACIALTFAGVAAVLAADYGREIRPLTIPADVVPFEGARGHGEFDKAA